VVAIVPREAGSGDDSELLGLAYPRQVFICLFRLLTVAKRRIRHSGQGCARRGDSEEESGNEGKRRTTFAGVCQYVLRKGTDQRLFGGEWGRGVRTRLRVLGRSKRRSQPGQGYRLGRGTLGTLVRFIMLAVGPWYSRQTAEEEGEYLSLMRRDGECDGELNLDLTRCFIQVRGKGHFVRIRSTDEIECCYKRIEYVSCVGTQ
jgi:hypothetical protein